MKVDLLLGLQWGDEGKGKIVDLITSNYDIIARFQGGANAGHSLSFNGINHVLHLIPSGIFHENKINIIGNGVVLDPIAFATEISDLEKLNINPKKKLLISKKAHLILPTHMLLDAALENKKGNFKIGSTLKGIGPAYTDKAGRNGIRINDIFESGFINKFNSLANIHKGMLDNYGFNYEDLLPQMTEQWFEAINTLKQFQIIDCEYEIDNYLKQEKSILGEGAQGSLLDVDFGAYPFVTSSNTVAAGAMTGLGIAPSKTGKVIGIVKAYCTRVGNGPFPTELNNNTGDLIRKAGAEYGATTGRPRRCGWLDLVALKYAVMLNGVTEIALTKSDVLSLFNEIKVCTDYIVNGKTTDRMPVNNNVKITPKYISLKGWNNDISHISDYELLPIELKEYVYFIEKETGIKISIISVGPDREQSIFK